MMFKLFVFALICGVAMSAQLKSASRMNHLDVCSISGQNGDGCHQQFLYCTHPKQKELCRDQTTCKSCLGPDCGVCAEAIYASTRYPTGTYNYAFPECDSTDAESEPAVMCDFYCRAKTYPEGKCMSKTNQCYCSWLSNVQETFDDILTNEESGGLIDLIGGEANEWELVWNSGDLLKSKEGFKNKEYFAKIKDVKETLTIIQTLDFNDKGRFVFGGYSSIGCSGNQTQIKDPKAFIFSLLNPANVQGKYLPRSADGANAVYCNEKYGPTFGAGDRPDFSINPNAEGGVNGVSAYFALNFRVQNIVQGSAQARNFLSGSPNFTVQQVAVYKRRV